MNHTSDHIARSSCIWGQHRAQLSVPSVSEDWSHYKIRASTCSLASLVRALWANISMMRPILSSTGKPQAACKFLNWIPLSSVLTTILQETKHRISPFHLNKCDSARALKIFSFLKGMQGPLCIGRRWWCQMQVLLCAVPYTSVRLSRLQRCLWNYFYRQNKKTSKQ